MATDYDAPRKSDDDTESLEAIKERIPEKTAATTDSDEDHHDGFLGAETIQDDLDVVVIPAMDDEFTCSQCFIVKHHSQLSRKKKGEPICTECDF